MPACDRCAVSSGSVTPGKVRGSGGLTVFGVILLISGVTSGLVGEALRKNNDATWRLLVLAAAVMAAGGLLCVFARLVLLVLGRSRRRTDLSDAELEWGLDSAEDWLNPIRSGWRQPAAEHDRPVQELAAPDPPGPALPERTPPAYPSPERQPRRAPAEDRQPWPDRRPARQPRPAGYPPGPAAGGQGVPPDSPPVSLTQRRPAEQRTSSGSPPGAPGGSFRPELGSRPGTDPGPAAGPQRGDRARARERAAHQGANPVRHRQRPRAPG